MIVMYTTGGLGVGSRDGAGGLLTGMSLTANNAAALWGPGILCDLGDGELCRGLSVIERQFCECVTWRVHTGDGGHVSNRKAGRSTRCGAFRWVGLAMDNALTLLVARISNRFSKLAGMSPRSFITVVVNI